MSRPEKKIDWSLVDEMLIRGCLGNEIAALFDMHPNTFYDRVEKQFKMSFTDYQQEKRSIGKTILRAAQFDKAIGKTKKGDNTLLIWLGKQYLDQKENQELTVTKETVDKFSAIMNQISAVQSTSDLKIADSNMSNAERS